MRARRYVLAFMSAVVAVACRSSAAGRSSPAALVEAWTTAFEQRDLEALVDCYDPHPDVRIEHSFGEVNEGIDAIREHYRAAFEEVRFLEVAFAPDDPAQLAAGDGAEVRPVGRFTALTRAPDGGRWKVEIRTALTLRLCGGRWRIAAERSSPIPGTPRVRRLDG